ncbi:verprolin [Musa acuminata AAA Group]|uniref:verprolin n=1 Tax=Musa acuminata AAA Group TaxID=214697 RepID=UPI0031E18D28
MGSCVSKCYTSAHPPPPPPPDLDSCVLQDKLVISESAPPPNSLSCALSKAQTPSSSSCSLLSSSSPSVSSSSSSSSNSCSSTSSLLQYSSAHKHGEAVKPKPVKSAVQTLQPTPKKSVPAKRARSSSPNAVAGRKVYRTENSSVAVAAPQRRRSTQIEKQRHDVMAPQITARKDNTRLRQSLSSEKEIRVHHIHHVHNAQEVSSGVPLADDLDNPLISMDCFIFL